MSFYMSYYLFYRFTCGRSSSHEWMHCKAEELALLVEHVKLVSPQFEHFLRRVSPFSVVVIIVQCDSTPKFHDLARVESVNIWKIVVERVSSPNESSKLVKNPQCVWARIPVRSPVAHWPLSSNLAYYFDGFLDVLFLFVRLHCMVRPVIPSVSCDLMPLF